MAGGNASLDGFPEVLTVDIFQGSGAAPGRIVVDTVVYGETEAGPLPRITTLTLYARNYSGVWANIKMSKKPRAFNGRMRTVFEDSRWRLRDVTLGQNYNERDCNAVLYSGTEKTITQLVAIIAAASSLTITTGTLPDFKPQADWRGKRADVALQELLDVTGCRMVYDPTTFEYKVSAASSGTIAGIVNSERRFRPGPDIPVRNLIVKSAPRTYEDRLSATAVVFDDTNEIETVANPQRVFDNFANLSANPIKQSRYLQTAFRLWQVDITNRSLLGRRALSVMPGDDDLTYAGARFIKPTLADVPQYVPCVQQSKYGSNALGLTAGGKMFVSEHPFIQGSGSSVLTTATILCAYYETSGGAYVRDSVSIPINGSALSDLEIVIEWIRPVESSEDDIDGSDWDTLHNTVANAIATKYSVQPQHVTIATLVDHGAIGQLGAVRYVMVVGSNGFIETSMAFNFEPADSRGM